jgi:hypothetical protein
MQSYSNNTFLLEVPLSKLSKEDRERYVEYRIRNYYSRATFEASTPSLNRKSTELRKLRDLWAGEKQEELYRYLTDKTSKEMINSIGEKEIIEMGLPAKVRHTPILKQRLQTIITQELMRPLIPQVSAIDSEILERKQKVYQETIHRTILNDIKQANKASDAIDELVKVREQMIKSAQQMENADATIKQLSQQIAELQKMKSYYEKYDEKKMQVIYREKQMTYKDQQEVMSTQALHEFIEKNNLKKIINDGMQEQIIHDKEIYYCGYEESRADLQFKLVYPENIWYELPSDNAIYISEANVVVEYMPMSIELLRHQYGNYLTAEELQLLTSRDNYGSSMNSKLQHNHSPYDIKPDGEFVNLRNLGQRTRNSHSSVNRSIDVHRFFWKEPSVIYWLVKEGDKSADEESLEYDDEWIEILTDDEVEKWIKQSKSKRKGYKIKKCYRNELWQAHLIDREYIVKVSKVKNAVRYPDEYGDVEMPYIGYAITNINYSNSLLAKSRPLQELYDIVNFKEEYTIALSGVKGLVLDIAMIPSGMSEKEWRLHRKQGTLKLSKYKNGERLEGVTDNQLTAYDDTLSEGVLAFTSIKESILSTIGTLTGINEQTIGNVAQQAAVGTTQIAIDQSNIMIEYYFQRHEHLVSLLLQRLVNLFPSAYKKGKKGGYLFGHRQQLLDIPPNSLKGNYVVSIKNGREELNIINAIRQQADLLIASGGIDFASYVEILDNKNIQDLKYIISESQDALQQKLQTNQAQQAEQAQQSQQALLEQQTAMQERITKMQGDQVKELEAIKGRMAQLKEEAKIKAQQEIAAIQQGLQKDVATLQSDTTKYQTDVKAETEAVKAEIENKKIELENALGKATLLAQTTIDTISINQKTKK